MATSSFFHCVMIDDAERAYRFIEALEQAEHQAMLSKGNACDHCPAHPQNGGSGVCSCTRCAPEIT